MGADGVDPLPRFPVCYPIADTHEAQLEETRAVLEKTTMVQMALAFAVAVKHYLRREEGIHYEDMYELVRFIPSLHLPRGIPTEEEASIGLSASMRGFSSLQETSCRRSSTTSRPAQTLRPDTPTRLEKPIPPSGSPSPNNLGVPHLKESPTYLLPGQNPPVFRWSEHFPFRLFVSRSHRLRNKGRKEQRRQMKEAKTSGGVGSNVPLEITFFMSNWIAAMQKRKTLDVPTVNALLGVVANMVDSLSHLERILTTPIPWSYSAHIWEISVMYCFLLPFQLYSSFGYLTIPAAVVTSYIIIGFAEIGSEIENPFGYDPNDLNLDFFVDSIIRPELAAIIARPFPPTTEWIFSSLNTVCSNDTSEASPFSSPKKSARVGADKLQYYGIERVRQGLELRQGEHELLRAVVMDRCLRVVVNDNTEFDGQGDGAGMV